MYKSIDFFREEILRHVDEIEKQGGDSTQDAADEIEARLLSIALLMRLLAERKLVDMKHQFPLSGGNSIDIGELWNAMIHQTQITTDLQAREEGMSVVSRWGRRYTFALEDFLDHGRALCRDLD